MRLGADNSRTGKAALCHPERMAFVVYESAGGAPIEFGDRASYSFNQAGFLVIVNDDGTRLTYSHTAWHHVEDRPRSGAFG